MPKDALSREGKEGLKTTLSNSPGLLLCCDFDGTLVPFTEDPEETELPESQKELLQDLAGLAEVHLAVISGRDFEQLTQLVPIEEVILAGNHGLNLMWEDGDVHRPELDGAIEDVISRTRERVCGEFGDLPGIIIEDKGIGLTVHYRKYAGDPKVIKEKFYQIWSEYRIPELELLKGAKLLEIRPSGWNKGDALKTIRRELPDMPAVYIGDDTTDEDAFAVLRDDPNGYPVFVGQDNLGGTLATHFLEDTDRVTEFLNFIYSFYR
ncbi:trehalose-phosphatase [Candidatus Bipolaricaulota bacterium]|nr:trehalose-phosphatase [Candidatus Bipolaricaulota bacterium]